MANNDPNNPSNNAQRKQIEAQFRALQNALSQIYDMQDDLVNAMSNLDSTGRKVNVTLRRNRKLFDDVEDTLDTFNESYKDYNDLAKALKNFVGLKLNPKSINALMNILRETGMTVRELQDSLKTNARYLQGDLLELHNDIKDLKDTELELIEDVHKSLDNTHKMAMKHGQDFAEYQANLASSHQKLSTALNRIASRKPLAGMKLDPQAAASNLKKILQSGHDKLANMKSEFGIDSGTITRAAAELQESYNKVSDWEAEIARIMSDGAYANTKAGQKQLKRYTQAVAKETVAAHMKINKIEEMGEHNRELVKAASGGYAALLDLAEDTHVEFQRGVNAFRSGDFVEALSAFASAKKKAAFTGAAGSVAAKATGGAGGAAMGVVGMLGKFTLAINAIGAIIGLLVQARDQAADMNKQLVGIYGLSDMGIDMQVDGAGEISQKLLQARNEVMGQMGEMFKFGVDSSEVMEALDAMEKAGITRQRIIKEGATLKDAMEGVFTYSKAFGKSYGEMGSLMGKFAYELNMGIGTTEAKFAEIQKNWLGTRLSIDDFVSSIEETTFENAIYGNRMSEVTRLMGLTGKNALLGGKQLLDAQKQFTSAIDNMDVGLFRAQIESMGTGNYTAFLKKQAGHLQTQLSQVPDQLSEEAMSLKRRISTINLIVEKIGKGSASMQDYKRAALMASEQGQADLFLQFMKNYLIKNEGVREDAFNRMDINGIMEKYASRLIPIFFEGNEENYRKVQTLLAGVKGTNGQVFGSVNALQQAFDANQVEIEDMTKRNKKNIDSAITAGALMVNSEKLRKIAGEQILHKISYATERIETLLLRILGMDNKQKNKEGFEQSISNANEQDVGSVKYQENMKDAVTKFFDFATDSRTTEEEVKKAWDKMTPDQKKIAAEVGQGNFKSLDKINFSKEDKENLATKGTEALRKLPQSERDKALETAGTGGKGATKAPITPKLAGLLDDRAATNLRSGGKLSAAEIAFSKQFSQSQGMKEQATLSPYLGKGMEFGFDAKKNKGDVMGEFPVAGEGYEVKSPFDGKIVKAGNREVQIQASGKGKSYTFKMLGLTPLPDLNGSIKKGDLVGRAMGTVGLSVWDSKGNKVNIGPGEALAQMGLLNIDNASKAAAAEQEKLLKQAATPAAPAKPDLTNPNAPKEEVQTETGMAAVGPTAVEGVFNPFVNITGDTTQNTYESTKETIINLKGVPLNQITTAAAKEAARIVYGHLSTERTTQ